MARVDLLAMVTLVKELLATVPMEQVLGTLRDRGARIQLVAGATVVQFAGVRASATAGEAAALEGWLKAAYRKLDRQVIARMGK